MTKLHESYTRSADTDLNEAADAAKLDAPRVARKQTNEDRATAADQERCYAKACQGRCTDTSADDKGCGS